MQKFGQKLGEATDKLDALAELVQLIICMYNEVAQKTRGQCCVVKVYGIGMLAYLPDAT